MIATTKEQVTEAFKMCAAIGEAIRDLKQIPSGKLYAMVMTHMDIEIYQCVIAKLKETGLVREENHMLIWCEPTQAQKEMAVAS